MNESVAVAFLLLVAAQDSRWGRVSWLTIGLFFGLALVLGYPQSLWAMPLVYGLCYLIAIPMERLGGFGGGDIKAVVVLSGFVGPWMALGTLIVAFAMWVATKYPDKVLFVPYLLTSYLTCFFLQAVLVHIV